MNFWIETCSKSDSSVTK